jgi:WD40 repeat protein
MTMRRFAFIVASLITATASGEDVSFQRDIWPVFKRHCVGCHNEKKSKGDLRMDDVAALLKGGKTGPLFEKGKPDDSLLITQVSGDKPEMPENEAPLSAAKVKLLRDWIAQGAKIDAAPKSTVPPLVIPAIYATAPAVSSVTISPDGKFAAAACRSEVVMFNVDDDSAPRRIATDFDLVTHVEFSPDGKRLAAAGGSPQQFGGVIFFDAADGKKQSARRIGTDTFFKGNFAPDGQAIALGGPTGAIFIIPVNPKMPPKTIELHSDWVTDVAYTADGKQLVSGSRDKTTKVSSVESLSLLRSVDESAEAIYAVAADPLNAISGGNARTLTAFDFKLALGGIQVTGSGNGARPVSNRAQFVRNFETQADAVMALATSGDRKLLAVATRTAEVRIYQTDTRARKATIPKAPAPVLSIALSRDGARLILGSKTGEVQIWDTASVKLIKALTPVPVRQAGIAGK